MSVLSVIGKFTAAAICVGTGYGIGYSLDDKTPATLANCSEMQKVEDSSLFTTLADNKICLPKVDLYTGPMSGMTYVVTSVRSALNI